ncbi:hypothetical protein FRC11_005548 [Ceratobasidium sp. 423]|nr:hypothetical protein FRC11_005548 [Ceratobasidium sp. 423]
MHTTRNPTLPSLAALFLRETQVTRSPYPVAHKPMAPVTPGRKAYSQFKSVLSSFKLTNARKRTTQAKETGTTTNGDEVHASSGQLALGHANSTQAHRCEMQAPTGVASGQLAPEHANTTQAEPRQATVRADEYYGYAQVAKTSARSLSTLLDCPETLPSTDPADVNPDLAHFIAYALYRPQLPLCVHHYALHLTWRVKFPNPDFNPKHAHGTYLTALMLAAKQSHDIDYSINAWASAGKHIFEASQLRENEWRMCERLQWRFLVDPMDLVKLGWTIEMEYGELDKGVLPSGPIAHIESEVGLSRMFAASVASSLSSFSTLSSCSPSSPWSGLGDTTPSGSSALTPLSGGPFYSSPSPFTSV